jgi:hypothetical protein
LREFARHKRKDKNYRILQGLICKADTPSSSSVQGRPAAIGVGGAGDLGGQGLDWWVREVEEIEGNLVERLSAAETQRGSRN